MTATRPAVLQDLVRSAIAVVAGSLSGRCATVLLGLDPNTFDLAPNLLREEAADIYGLSLERFRRNPQTRILTIVATQILEACYAHRARPLTDPHCLIPGDRTTGSRAPMVRTIPATRRRARPCITAPTPYFI